MIEPAPDFSRELTAFYGDAPAGTLKKLKGDASTRRYYRFRADGARAPRSLIIMHLPETEETKAAGRAQAASFGDVQRLLAARGIPVPQIYASHVEQGVMLLEDLGDEMFETRVHATLKSGWPGLYACAIDRLAELHAACAPPQDPNTSIVYRRRFEPALLRWELDHFREYGLCALHGPLAPADRAELDTHFDALTAAITALPDGLVHRDYQSRNLMWAPDGRLVVIDFQDAMIGPAPYDLVALLCDSYVVLDAALQRSMLARYAERRGYSSQAEAALVHGFQLISVQRKLKDAGRFVFIDRVRGNPDFLPFFTDSLRYADRALAALPELTPLRTLLQRLLPGFPELSAPGAAR